MEFYDNLMEVANKINLEFLHLLKNMLIIVPDYKCLLLKKLGNCEVIDMSTNLIVVTVLRYIYIYLHIYISISSISNHHIVYRKHTQSYVSIIFQ